MLPRGSCVINLHDLDMFPGLDLYCTDPAQYLITANEDLDDLSVDDLSARRVEAVWLLQRGSTSKLKCVRLNVGNLAFVWSGIDS